MRKPDANLTLIINRLEDELRELQDSGLEEELSNKRTLYEPEIEKLEAILQKFDRKFKYKKGPLPTRRQIDYCISIQNKVKSMMSELSNISKRIDGLHSLISTYKKVNKKGFEDKDIYRAWGN